MMARMMNMRELLKDPLYRRYFLLSPRFPYSLAIDKPWRLWVDLGTENESNFRKKDFETFGEAFNYIKVKTDRFKKIPDRIADFAISSRIIGFVAPKSVQAAYLEDYQWCIMCRRPTLFEPYETHHALRQSIHRYFTDVPVCIFCGNREQPQVTRVRERRTYNEGGHDQ
jgi:hypothetical protein